MEVKDTYRSLGKKSTGSFRDRGSRFLAFAHPVSSVDEVKEILKGLRREYHDARHHCYAYRLGVDRKEYRANDDGEPTHSAGKPILGQIDSFDLSNVLVVVVRYFGGTLLGVGGLIKAYRSAARDALQKAEIIEKTEDAGLEILFPYSAMDRIMKTLDLEQVKILEREFADTCRILGSVRKNRAAAVRNMLIAIPGTKVVNSY
jgi:uncharacterized YigZ family protein